MMLKTATTLITTIAAIFLPAVDSASPFIIADDRVRSLDISPVLGRGYSIMTNTYQSTCLVVEQTTVPSFNYDYFFTDFTSSDSDEKSLSGKISASFSYPFVSGSLTASASSTSKVETSTHTISATMKIERYYSSVREEVSPLANDAFTLLERQDYVGFFKACGPNYVRSLRRAQEVTALFQFTTTSSSTAREFSMGLQVSTPVGGGGAEFSAKSKFSSASSSLTISIVGFGLGLNQEGSETMVATNLEEYQGVMRYCFKSMTVNEDAHNIGMVYGMEVVPWVNNLAFQVAAKVAEENVLIPMPRSLIQRAFKKADHTNFDWTSSSKKDDFRCKDKLLFVIDKYGFCCEKIQLYDPQEKVYRKDSETQLTRDVCKPVYNLDKALVKDNMANNGEFVARLDNSMRYKLAQLGSLEKCITAIKAVPLAYHDNILKPNDSVRYDKEVDTKYSVKELSVAVDPLSDYGMMMQMGRELDEWIEMYYSRCLGALYGMNIGTTPDPDASLFMAYPWHTYSECMMLSCVINNMRWDREFGTGCVPSAITGSIATAYSKDATKNTKCAMDGTKFGATEVCKYDSVKLEKYMSFVNDCWKATIGETVGIDYLINHFCNPQLTADKKDTKEYNSLKLAVTNSCKKPDPAIF